MLTPQEVSERVFPKASFGGYNMASVDEFLDILTEDYSTLYSENAVLKSKMKVLVEKVDEYRSTEEAMRKALMTAQRMAEDLVNEAKQEAETIRSQALADAKAQTASLSSQRETEEFRLSQAQKATADFVQKVKALHSEGLAFLDNLDTLCPPSVEPVQEDTVDDTISEIDENVQRLLSQAMSDVEAQREAEAANTSNLEDTAEFSIASEEETEGEGSAEPTTRIDFGALQFGRDYEIK